VLGAPRAGVLPGGEQPLTQVVLHRGQRDVGTLCQLRHEHLSNSFQCKVWKFLRNQLWSVDTGTILQRVRDSRDADIGRAPRGRGCPPMLSVRPRRGEGPPTAPLLLSKRLRYAPDRRLREPLAPLVFGA